LAVIGLSPAFSFLSQSWSRLRSASTIDLLFLHRSVSPHLEHRPAPLSDDLFTVVWDIQKPAGLAQVLVWFGHDGLLLFSASGWMPRRTS
jgi:hypothetical protein